MLGARSTQRSSLHRGFEAGQAGDVEPRLLEYRARVAERAEAVPAVIGAHAGRTDAAERQVLHRIVEDDVVDRDAA